MSTGQCSLASQRRLGLVIYRNVKLILISSFVAMPLITTNSDTHGPLTRPHSFAPPSYGEPTPAEIGLPSPQQRVTPLPIPVRGTIFDGSCSVYSFMIAPILRILFGISPLQCPGSATSQESSCQANPLLTLNCESKSSQQLHSPSDQYNSDSTAYNESKSGNKFEPTTDCGRFPSATDQTINNFCCNGDLNHVHLTL